MKTLIIEYLVKHYGITKAKAEKLCLSEDANHAIKSAEQWNSKPYYPAGIIAKKNDLTHPEPCSACAQEDREFQESQGI